MKRNRESTSLPQTEKKEKNTTDDTRYVVKKKISYEEYMFLLKNNLLPLHERNEYYVYKSNYNP